MCMALKRLTLDLPVMLQLDLSMLGITKLTLNCNKLMYANLRGSYKLTSEVRGADKVLEGARKCCICFAESRHGSRHIDMLTC